MALTDRERKIMMAAAAAILLLVLNRYVLSPVMEKRSQAAAMRTQMQADVEQSLASLSRQKLLRQRWQQMQENGLGGDVQKAEAMVYRFIEDASARSGFELGSIQPDRAGGDGGLGRIDFVLAGTGSMQSVTRFLWDLEMARIPLKVKSYQLGSKNETAEQMTLQVELSTVYIIEETNATEKS